MITVAIRNKNQAKALNFLLTNLNKRYSDDIDEIIVLDNKSTDGSLEIIKQHKAKLVSVLVFSYGGSANTAASSSKNDIVVLFSAHSYPVSPEFFKVIKSKFKDNRNLAGLRCLHSTNDFRNYINNVNAREDSNKSGLIFSGSAFNKSVWVKIKFNDNVPTFEDKDWTLRVLKAGYDIDFAPVVFNYEIKRNKVQEYFRFKNDVLGNYQIWHQEVSYNSIFKGLIGSNINNIKSYFVAVFYSFKRFFYLLYFKNNKPNKFDY
jgi:glycosyltransferase involved in cell wall biosynthesis